MSNLFLVFLSISFFFILSYFIMLALFAWGWIKQTPDTTTKSMICTKVSVVVPMRNEERNIINCLSAIINQSVSSDLYEIIVVDDNSEDNSVLLVNQFIKEHNTISIKLIVLNSFLTGKKQAIKQAIEKSTGELIVTTDADCIMEKDWLFSIIHFYEKTNAQMIVGPVCFYNEKTVFEKMQTLEFNALIISTAGALYYNKPIMCNGANLAYTKSIFNQLNGFDSIDEISTGDDVLLMYKLAKEDPEKVKFLKEEKAIVYTKAKLTIAEFVNQRIRWASKPMRFLNFETKAVSITVFMANSSFLYLFISSIYLLIKGIHSDFLAIYLILLLIKCFIDFLLLFLATSFFKRKAYLIYFLPQQIAYSMYVFLIALLSLRRKYSWKGRFLKN